MTDQGVRIPALRLLPRRARRTGAGRRPIGLALGLVLLAGFGLLALAPAVVTLPAPDAMDLLARLSGPSPAHPLGTDHLGRDVFSRLVGAVPVSLGAALTAMAAILAVSLPWGVLGALAGGRVDAVMMRLADIVMAFPILVPPLAVIVSLETASVLLALSSLSFLGIGAQPPTPEWGAMLNEARPFFAQAPHMLIVPGMAVTLAVLAFNLVGEGLRALLDKREPYRW